MTAKEQMALAAKAATAGTDCRKVGAVIISRDDACQIAVGFNSIGTMHGLARTDERMTAPAKYSWIEHAERRAIYEAARFGRPLEGAVMVVTWFPCVDCARAIVECRMSELIYGKEPDYDDPVWGDGFRIAKTMLKEAGVKMRCEPCES